MSFPPDPTMQGPMGPPPGPMGPPPGPGFNGPPPQPPSSGSNPALIIGILVLVAGLIAAGAFVLLSGDDEKEGEGEEASSRDRTEQSDDNNQNEDCATLSAPGQEEDGEGQSQDGGESEGSGSGSEGGGSEGTGSGEGQDGCAPDVPTDVEVPEVDVEVPEVDVEVPEDDTTDAPSSGGDVMMTFAEEIYTNTPGAVGEEDAICLSESVIAVVGESAVEAGGYDPMTIWGGTSGEEDAAIAGGAYSCTSSGTDQALADEVGGYWPDAWNPGS